MSKQLDVLLAVQALAKAALPFAEVLGLENEAAAPDRVPVDGRVVVRPGDPGDPEMTLSPLTYEYDHQIPLELAARKDRELGTSSAEQVSGMIDALSGAIAADRTLGGLVDWLDATAPGIEDVYVAGGEPYRAAFPILVASYATTTPL